MRRGAWFAVAACGAGVLLAGCASDRSPAFLERVGEAARVAGDRAVYRRYRGKYTGDPRLAAGMDRVEKVLPAAEERVRRRLGTPSLAFPPFAVCFVDGEGSGTDGSMETGLVTLGHGDVCVVAVITEDLVSGQDDDERFLAHELTHVLHISGGESAGAPLWLAEGIARWVEIEDDATRADFLLSYMARRSGPKGSEISRILGDEPSLENREGSQQSVAGAVVFFQLEWSRGTEAVRRLILRLLREKDWKAVLREETGRPLDEMFKEVLAGYQEWSRKTFPGQEELNPIPSIAGGGKPVEAIAALDAFVEGHPGDPRLPMCACYRGHLLHLAGDLDGALASFRAYRREHPKHFGVLESMCEQLEVHRERGDWEEAAALARTLLGDHLWAPSSADARRAVEGTLEEAVGRIRSRDRGPGEKRPGD
jgi:hypothetical protein